MSHARQATENFISFDSNALAGLRGISALHIVLFHSLTYCLYQFGIYAQVSQFKQRAFNLGLSEWVIWRSNCNILLSLAFTLLSSLVKQWVKSKKSKNLIAQPWMEYEAYQLSTLYYSIPFITAHLISIFMDRFTCPCFSFSLDFAWPLDMARPNMMAMRYVVDPAQKSVVDVVVVKLEQKQKRKSSIPTTTWLAGVPEFCPFIGWPTFLDCL